MSRLSSVRLSHWKHKELKKLCHLVGLAIYGTKQDLLARFDTKRVGVLAASRAAKAGTRDARNVRSRCKRLKKAMKRAEKRAETTLARSTAKDVIMVAKWAKRRVTREADAERKLAAKADREVQRMRQAIRKVRRGMHGDGRSRA